jgi:GT2 family glycosyltransferase/glycosyltransferase involved in cell wall biosynthesis
MKEASDAFTPDATAADAPLNILVVHETLPFPDRSGSDLRVVQVLTELRAQGHQVAYVARNGLGFAQYAPPLQNLSIPIWAHDAERLRFYMGDDSAPQWTFDAVLEGNRFDLAILFLWFWNGISVPEHYLEEIRRLSPHTRIVVISEDQHGLRELRMADLTHSWSDYERGIDFTNRELEVYRRADMVRVISDDDRRGLLQKAPELNIEVMPMVAAVAPEGPGFAGRCGFLLVGNYDNLATRDGAAWMLSEVWPKVRRQLPNATLDLVGNNLPADLGAGQAGIRRVGYVRALDPVFTAHRVFVSPVRFGTGIKTKNLGALAHGLPLVTSTVGAEGMGLAHGAQALIADTPEAFAAAMVRVYNDEPLWRDLARNGRLHIVQEFSLRRLQAAIRRLVDEARRAPAKPYNPDYYWSYLLVEKRYPCTLTYPLAAQRTPLRTVGYVNLAEEFLDQHRPAEALDQLRHILCLTRGKIPDTVFMRHTLALLARCYRELGDNERAAAYERTAQIPPLQSAGSTARPRKRHGRKGAARQAQLDLSVIIPTFNRRDTLCACLTRLAVQTLPASRWEAIVVDDGSTDGTEELCRTFPKFYPLKYFRQANAGAGAARRAGVEHAEGEYVLFINDDTMASEDLLAEHLRTQHQYGWQKVSVLGNFQYPAEARGRALAGFLTVDPFLFPQATLKPGLYAEPAFFVTCNLSVLREAVLAAGSFDPKIPVGEDTDLGIRLKDAGYRVLYHPEASAIHDHLGIGMGDLVRRARFYGRNRLSFYRKHPRLLGDGTGPFGRLDEAAVRNIESYVEQHRAEVANALRAVSKYETLDFLPFFSKAIDGVCAADVILGAFKQAVPAIYQLHLYEGFLEAWREQRECVGVPAPSEQ